MVETIFRKFYIKFGKSLWKVYGISKLISRTFENKKYGIIKFKSSRNEPHQYFEKILRKIS